MQRTTPGTPAPIALRARTGLWRGCAVTFALLWSAFASTSAWATPMAFAQMSGFDNSAGLAERFVIQEASDWLFAGNPASAMPGMSLALTVNETSQCLKTQAAPDGPCVSPEDLFTGGQNYVSDVTWVIENTSGAETETLLWFSTVNNTNGRPAYDRPDVAIESTSATLDGNPIPLEVVRYTAMISGVPTDFFYLGVDLAEFGNSGDDGTATLTFRYLVDNALLEAGTPELALNAAQDFKVVPEPTTALLVGAGLGLLAVRTRRRAATQSA